MLRHWISNLKPDEIQAVAAIASILLSIGLGAFTVVQVRLQRRTEEREAAAERRENERLRAAEEAARFLSFSFVQAEYLRVASIRDRWNHYSLFKQASHHVLRPDELLARDPGSLTEHLARVHPATAYLGMHALAGIHDVAFLLADYKVLVEKLIASFPLISEDQAAKHNDSFLHMRDAVVMGLDAALASFRDAIVASGYGDTAMPAINPGLSLESDAGKQLQKLSHGTIASSAKAEGSGGG